MYRSFRGALFQSLKCSLLLVPSTVLTTSRGLCLTSTEIPGLEPERAGKGSGGSDSGRSIAREVQGGGSRAEGRGCWRSRPRVGLCPVFERPSGRERQQVRY